MLLPLARWLAHHLLPAWSECNFAREPRRSSFRPQLEPLEDRCLLSLSIVPPTANIDVSQMRGNEAEGTIAIDPTSGGKNLFAASVKFGPSNPPGIFAAYSADAGATWTTSILATGNDSLPRAADDPKATFDTYGNLFLVYHGSNTLQKGNSTSSTLTTLVDTSRSWATNEWANMTVVVVVDGKAQFNTILSNTANTLTVKDNWVKDPGNGSPYEISYDASDVKRCPIVVALSTDDGKTFNYEAMLDPSSSAAADAPAIATGSAGTFSPGNQSVWVTWTDVPTDLSVKTTRIRAAGALVSGKGTTNVRSFDLAENVSPVGAYVSHSDVQVGPAGQVLVSYQSDFSFEAGVTSPANVYTAIDSDGLGTGAFGAPVPVDKAAANALNVGAQSGQNLIPAQPSPFKVAIATGKS